jgi:hypothetical protein
MYFEFAQSAYSKSNIALVASGPNSAELSKWVGQFFKGVMEAPRPRWKATPWAASTATVSGLEWTACCLYLFSLREVHLQRCPRRVRPECLLQVQHCSCCQRPELGGIDSDGLRVGVDGLLLVLEEISDNLVQFVV